jgi:hypothetical protein
LARASAIAAGNVNGDGSRAASAVCVVGDDRNGVVVEVGGCWPAVAIAGASA